MQSTIRVGILFILAILDMDVPGRAAPFPATLNLLVSRTPQQDGTSQFFVDAFTTGLATFQMPDGTTGIAHSSLVQRVFPSFSDLQGGIVGDWGINFTTPAEHYDFSISAFPESVFSSNPPVITSPADGAVVSPTFTMNWQWPAGVQSTAHSVLIQSSRAGQSTGRSTFNDSSPVLSEVISQNMNNGPQDQLVLRVGTWETTLSPYVSAVTSNQASPRFAFAVSSTVASYSLPVTVKFVPEPTTATLLLLGMLGCGWWRRRGNS